MTVTIAHMRAAGLTAEKIVAVLEAAENEKLARRREQNRKAQQNHRARQQNSADSADSADTLSPSSPPSMVSPITPSLTTPSSTPIPDIRAVAVATRPDIADDFEKFWKVYPRRDGANPKAPARKKFIAAVRGGTEPSAIIFGASGYAQAEGERVGTVYIAQAVTWLNQRRWEDYAASATGPPAPWEPPPGSGLPSREELERRYAERGPTSSTTAESSGILPPSKCLQNGAEIRTGLDRSGKQTIRSLASIFPSAGLAALRHSND